MRGYASHRGITRGSPTAAAAEAAADAAPAPAAAALAEALAAAEAAAELALLAAAEAATAFLAAAPAAAAADAVALAEPAQLLIAQLLREMHCMYIHCNPPDIHFILGCTRLMTAKDVNCSTAAWDYGRWNFHISVTSSDRWLQGLASPC